MGRPARDQHVEPPVIEVVIADIRRNAVRSLERALQRTQFEAIRGQREGENGEAMGVRIAGTTCEERTQPAARPERDVLGVHGWASAQECSRDPCGAKRAHFPMAPATESANYPPPGVRS